MMSFVKKKGHEKDVGIVTFDLIGLLPINHIIAYYSGIREFVKKHSMLTVK